MLARLLLVGVAWLTALVLFAVLLEWSGSPPTGLDAGREGVTALARSLNQLRPAAPAQEHSWSVTKATSALRSLVVEVDAIDPGDAHGIAARLVDGVRSDYDLVLVYVQARDVARDPVVRRIEWTPRRGYLATTF